eukprot:403362673
MILTCLHRIIVAACHNLSITSQDAVQPESLNELSSEEVQKSVLDHSKQQNAQPQNLIVISNDQAQKAAGFIAGLLKPLVDNIIKKAEELKNNPIVDRIIATAKDQWDRLPADQKAKYMNDINKYIEALKKKWNIAIQLNALSAYNVKMDLEKNLFILESKVKDENGEPIMTLEMDENGKFTDPIAQALLGEDQVQEIKEIQEVTDGALLLEETTPTEHKPELIPVNSDAASASDAQPQNEEQIIDQKDAPIFVEKKSDDTIQVITDDGSKDVIVDPKLTEEEEFEMQREVAFKVVFFFVTFIVFCFGLLYVYHRIQQASIPPSEKKQNFFDFLTGDLDDEEIGEIQTSRFY